MNRNNSVVSNESHHVDLLFIDIGFLLFIAPYVFSLSSSASSSIAMSSFPAIVLVWLLGFRIAYYR